MSLVRFGPFSCRGDWGVGARQLLFSGVKVDLLLNLSQLTDRELGNALAHSLHVCETSEITCLGGVFPVQGRLYRRPHFVSIMGFDSGAPSSGDFLFDLLLLSNPFAFTSLVCTGPSPLQASHCSSTTSSHYHPFFITLFQATSKFFSKTNSLSQRHISLTNEHLLHCKHPLPNLIQHGTSSIPPHNQTKRPHHVGDSLSSFKT